MVKEFIGYCEDCGSENGIKVGLQQVVCEPCQEKRKKLPAKKENIAVLKSGGLND